MPDLLIYADTVRSPEMRHEIPLTVPDPFLFVEHDGLRHVVVGAMEVARISGIDGGLDVRPSEEFGRDELTAQGLSPEEVNLEVVVRACQELGVQDATVPAGFPVETADRLRRAGIEVSADRRALRGRAPAQDGRGAGGRAPGPAGGGGGHARRGGSPPPGRAERPRRAPRRGAPDLRAAQARHRSGVLAQCRSADEFIVAHGAQSAVGHDMGSGPIMAGEPVVIDLAAGRRLGLLRRHDPDLRGGRGRRGAAAYHRLAREALDRSVEAIRAGVAGAEVFRISCACSRRPGSRHS